VCRGRPERITNVARKKQTNRARLVAAQAAALAEYAGNALVAAGHLRIKTKAVEPFPLDGEERAAVGELPALAAKLKKKLTKEDGSFTVAEVAGMVKAVAESLGDAGPEKQLVLLLASKKLVDCLQATIAMPAMPARAKKAVGDTVYQFRITLLESRPPIWRRIQVKDCTLDNLHEHIQTAMGWTNSHLHHFKVGDQLYGDPDLVQENFEDMGYKDSTTANITDILPRTGRRFRFVYEYDFGDSWDHEVLFEGVVRADPKVKYPLCLEGERACPPEDVGGVWGYADFLAAITDPEHKDHDGLLEWVGGSFDPEEFDPAQATRDMRKGLPDWRSMEGW
jgi:hypothetical protein